MISVRLESDIEVFIISDNRCAAHVLTDQSLKHSSTRLPFFTALPTDDSFHDLRPFSRSDRLMALMAH